MYQSVVSNSFVVVSGPLVLISPVFIPLRGTIIDIRVGLDLLSGMMVDP